MMKRIWALLAASLLVSSPAMSNDSVKVALPTHDLLYAPLYLASEAGLFSDAKLDVELILFKGGPPAMSALLSNAVQFCACASTTPLRAKAQGTDVMVVGTLVGQYALNVVVQDAVAKRLNLTDATPIAERLRALKGLTIAATSPGSGTELGLRFLYNLAGLAETDLTTVFLGGNAPMIASFSQGRIDGFITSTPATDIAVARYKGFTLVDMIHGQVKELEGYPYIVLAARQSFLKGNKDVTVRFMRAVAAAQQMIAKEPERAGKLVRKLFPDMSDDIFELSWKSSAAMYPDNPVTKTSGIERSIEILTKLQSVNVPGAAADYFDNSYVEAAK